MKRMFTMGLALLLALSAAAGGAAAADGAHSAAFDFAADDAGFTPIFADYPNEAGAEEFYELRHSHGPVPADGAGNGLFLSGNNHSDDLFMGYWKALDGFAPGRAYRFSVSFRLATDVEPGEFGVGGAPGESVTVKCGVTPTRPETVLVPLGNVAFYRLNLDAGQQSRGGRDLVAVGNLAKTGSEHPGAYELKSFAAEVTAAANAQGEVYLVIGTDSGFEATSAYYLDDVSVSWEAAATRGQAAQLLFETAGRPDTGAASSFRDVAADHPQRAAIAWAQAQAYLTGYGDGRFGPEDGMTAEQAAVMLYRFFGCPAADRSALARYEGREQVSPWAEDAVAWAIGADLFAPSSMPAPQDPVTAAQLTAWLQAGAALPA